MDSARLGGPGAETSAQHPYPCRTHARRARPDARARPRAVRRPMVAAHRVVPRVLLRRDGAGLKGGERVIVDGVMKIGPGAPVKVAEKPAPQKDAKK